MIYEISGKLTVSCWTKVQANSLEEALEIAREREVAGFEISGSYSDDESWHFDNDGTPFELSGD